MTSPAYISPPLRRPLRTLAQAHHAACIRDLRRVLAEQRLCIQDVTAAMKDCVGVAHYDEYLPRSYVRRMMFKALRGNLTAAKGDWERALAWTEDDAKYERSQQEEACFQDSAAEHRHQAYARPRVI